MEINPSETFFWIASAAVCVWFPVPYPGDRGWEREVDNNGGKGTGRMRAASHPSLGQTSGWVNPTYAFSPLSPIQGRDQGEGEDRPGLAGGGKTDTDQPISAGDKFFLSSA